MLAPAGPTRVRVRVRGSEVGTVLFEETQGPVNPALADALMGQLEPVLWRAYRQERPPPASQAREERPAAAASRSGSGDGGE